jgi:diadenylate cyclase
MNEYLSTLLRYRPAAGWWDLLDIAIVSILIYEFLKLIRGTRAVQMAAGCLLIVGLFYVSRLAPLQTLNWMIRNALVYVAFAAIVIFQSDIRRALAHFGRAPFFRYFSRQEATNETIEEVVVAATMLAAHQTGAIIAIEREIGLRNYIESGIPLDAEMTYDLLVTIFQPSSPLHDGAVVIQENRVAAAACFLPLTVNPQAVAADRQVGMRNVGIQVNAGDPIKLDKVDFLFDYPGGFANDFLEGVIAFFPGLAEVFILSLLGGDNHVDNIFFLRLSVGGTLEDAIGFVIGKLVFEICEEWARFICAESFFFRVPC